MSAGARDLFFSIDKCTLRSSLHKHHFSPSLFSVRRPFSPAPVLSLSLHKNSNSLSLLSLRFSRRKDGVFAGTDGAEEEENEEEGFEEEEELDEDDEYEDATDDNGFGYSIDIDALEREARDAAREYSTSLSRELRIGECFFFFWWIRIGQFCFTQFRLDLSMVFDFFYFFIFNGTSVFAASG